MNINVGIALLLLLPLKQCLSRYRGSVEQTELQGEQIREVLLLQLTRARFKERGARRACLDALHGVLEQHGHGFERF